MARNAVIYPAPDSGSSWPISSPIERDGPEGLREACVKAMQVHKQFPFKGARVEVTENDVPVTEMVPLIDILEPANK